MTAHFAQAFDRPARPAPGQGEMCFARGTRIATLRGEVAVEDLTPRHRVMTRDSGVQTAAWVGVVTVPVAQAADRPVAVRAGALGAGLPESDLVLPPTHRVLVFGDIARELFGADEIQVEASRLTVLDGVERLCVTAYDCVQVLLPAPAAVLANGAWAEAGSAPKPASTLAEPAGDLGALFPGLGGIGARCASA